MATGVPIPMPDVGPSSTDTVADETSTETTTTTTKTPKSNAWSLLPDGVRKLLKLQGYTPAGFNRYAAEGNTEALDIIVRSALKAGKFRGDDVDKIVKATLKAIEVGSKAPSPGSDEDDEPTDPALVGIEIDAQTSVQSELVTWWVDHFGVTPGNMALENMGKVISGDASIQDFQAWASTVKGFALTEDDIADMPERPEWSQLELDKRQKYYDIWGYEPPKGYMKDFADMNPLEFEAYERSKDEFNKTEVFRRERETLRAEYNDVFGIVRQDNNRFGFDDSTNDGVRHAGFLGAPPANLRRMPVDESEVPTVSWAAGDPSVFSKTPTGGGSGDGDGQNKLPKPKPKKRNPRNNRLDSNPGKPNARKGGLGG